MLDQHTHNRPFAGKRDEVGMDGVPKLGQVQRKFQAVIETFKDIPFFFKNLKIVSEFCLP